jgi:rubredoxin
MRQVFRCPRREERQYQLIKKWMEDNNVKKWQCFFCGFFYDEALGMPDEGIAAGTRWEDIPEDWTCPECGATKTDFAMIEIA